MAIRLCYGVICFLGCLFFFFFVRRPPPRSTLFPYTTLFRSARFPVSPNIDVGLKYRNRPRRTGERGPRGHEIVPSGPDRKSTRLNSSHVSISYAVFCLKKKKTTHSSLSTWRQTRYSISLHLT